MGDFQIRGQDDIAKLVKDIRAHADAKALRKGLYSGLNRVSKDIRGEMKEAIPAALPQRGGLAAKVAATTSFSTSAKGGASAGVTIWARNKAHDIRVLTGRRLRHPVYGNRSTWVNQTKGVEPAVFLGKFEEQVPSVRKELLKVLQRVADKLAKG